MVCAWWRMRAAGRDAESIAGCLMVLAALAEDRPCSDAESKRAALKPRWMPQIAEVTTRPRADNAAGAESHGVPGRNDAKWGSAKIAACKAA
jgi:hypothetical protein